MTRVERLEPDVRRQQILLTALGMAKRKNHLDITRLDVAKSLQVSPPLISRYFPTIHDLRDAVYQLAVDHEVVEVVAQRIPPEGRLSARLRKKLKKYLADSLTK